MDILADVCSGNGKCDSVEFRSVFMLVHATTVAVLLCLFLTISNPVSRVIHRVEYLPTEQ